MPLQPPVVDVLSYMQADVLSYRQAVHQQQSKAGFAGFACGRCLTGKTPNSAAQQDNVQVAGLPRQSLQKCASC